MRYLRLTLAVIVALSMVGGLEVEADTQIKAACNPSPSPDDLILPLPGGLEMAFRKIVVPGKDFWYDPEREVTLGDASAGADDPFSHERRVRVMGAFKDVGADHWWYPIGKYEVSKAQFAAVMGDGDIRAGLNKLAELSGDFRRYHAG